MMCVWQRILVVYKILWCNYKVSLSIILNLFGTRDLVS